MCGLLFEYDVRLSVKLYFAKSYMNIRTKKDGFLNRLFLFLNVAIIFKIKHLKNDKILREVVVIIFEEIKCKFIG